MAALELYRMTTIGVNLTATLDEMVFSGRLSPELAVRVQLQFDESMSALLEKQVTSMAFFKGNLHTYRYCDNVWTFILRDATFRNEEMAGAENIGNVMIVACNSSLLKPKEPPQQ
ncbi:transcription initiation factor IIA subunit 2-like [Lolium rigidum]|uniref:transcription initiation factor IIA subunit 2-like n=1 Tax=Lolium rigidum TaxID=89674 RepID=UPI001F5D42A4|nr:transcription initiation factor IIA subunit 2-like [Lolium rigidum]